MIYFLIYLLIISIIAVCVTIADKLKAIRGKWRIKERTLFIIAALGGSVAMFITMLLIHHKTRHARFMIGLPAIIAAQVVLAFFALRWLNVV